MNGTRGPLGSNFGSNALQSTIGQANYNALELSARHTSGRLEFAAAYTYSKSMDQSSNPAEEVYPFNPALSYAISSFDVKHNFVVSYEYQLPFDQFFHPNRLTRAGLWPGSRASPAVSRYYGEQWRQLADRDQSKRDQQQQHR